MAEEAKIPAVNGNQGGKPARVRISFPIILVILIAAAVLIGLALQLFLPKSSFGMTEFKDNLEMAKYTPTVAKVSGVDFGGTQYKFDFADGDSVDVYEFGSDANAKKWASQIMTQTNGSDTDYYVPQDGKPLVRYRGCIVSVYYGSDEQIAATLTVTLFSNGKPVITLPTWTGAGG